MKILLHICCAPCAIYPVDELRAEKFEVMGFFYRHNIHPLTECIKREETLKSYANKIGLKIIYQEGYDLEGFIRNVVFREKQRCIYCYHSRLEAAAKLARHGNFDFFTTTLLYSKKQTQDTIKEIAESVSRSVGIPFYYKDFRTGWNIGIEKSKQLNLYRQQYCGCIYSEKERYYRMLGVKC